jgi:hypothetical protein
LTKKSKDVDNLILNGLHDDENISNVMIYIYNKETVQAADLG